MQKEEHLLKKTIHYLQNRVAWSETACHLRLIWYSGYAQMYASFNSLLWLL